MSACPKVPGCGQEHPGCLAHNRFGAPCGWPPMKGADKCYKHIGRRTDVVKAEWDARQQGERIRATYDLPAQADPLNELLRISHEVIDWKNVCRFMVGNLTEISGAGEVIKAEIRMYENAMDRAIKVLSDLVRLGVEDRLAMVEERQTNLSIAAVESALVELAPLLGYDPDRPEIRAVVSAHLRAIQRDEEQTHG